MGYEKIILLLCCFMYKVSGGSGVDGDSGREVDIGQGEEGKDGNGPATLHGPSGHVFEIIFFYYFFCCSKVSMDQNEYRNNVNMELSVLSKVCSAIKKNGKWTNCQCNEIIP